MTKKIVLLPPEAPLLDDGAKLGGWWHDVEDDRMVCDLCPRKCVLKPGDQGFCFVRENRDGQMVLNTYGRSTGFCIDPIEKKPLNHFYPGTPVLSFGTAGCNLGCKFCQNHDISKSREVARLSEQATPQMIAAAARAHGCRSIAFTYNDPVIFAEYVIDVAQAARAEGIKTVAVTAGYITPEARRPFFDAIDAANVDLKGFTEEFYHKVTLSHLQPVLDTLRWLHHETDVWVEITNLIIPQENDSAGEIRRLCDWVLENMGDEVPVHFSAFHPDFRMLDRPNTPPETLLMARTTAIAAGLKHVYVGNIDDMANQSTYCPGCGQVLIERNWYELGAFRIAGGCCEACGRRIAGHFEDQRGGWGRRRLPIDLSRFAPPTPITSRAVSENKDTTMTPAGNEKNDPSTAQSPSLSETQQTAVHKAACRMLLETVCGGPAESLDETLDGAADQEVLGVFVTAKRRGKLRGCCGAQADGMRLLDALRTSAARTADDDPRFPPISPTELAYLDVEVSVLFGRQQVTARGEDRLGVVEVGKHGLQIALGNQRGLLLPQVASEGGLDAEQFLQHVCLKADLPPTAWKEDAAMLWTFEGIVFGGPLAEAVELPEDVAVRPKFIGQDLTALANYCRDNLLTMARGATPNYYVAGVPDGNVTGIAVDLGIDGENGSHSACRLKLRGAMPAQSTLFEMAREMAGPLTGRPGRLPTPEQIELGIAILGDVALHGTVAEPDLRGIEPWRRAVMVRENKNMAWVYDPDKSAEELLAAASKAARVRNPKSANVMSLDVSTSEPTFLITQVARPMPGPSVRAPGVAGKFYPHDPAELGATLDDLFSGDAPAAKKWPAAMVPHAGLMFSGRIAADVLRRIEIPETVIIIGPKHTPLGVEWAVTPHATWSLPGIELAADQDLAEKLAHKIDGLELDALAHQQEHAIEVELPLIARLNPAAKVVGIAIGSASLEQCQKFAEQFSEVLADRRESTLLLISSDMNHFASDEENRRLDEIAIASLETLDPAALFQTVTTNHISMCGLRPAVIVLETLRRWGTLAKADRVAYGTSAEISGDKSRVVGYAGMLFG